MVACIDSGDLPGVERIGWPVEHDLTAGKPDNPVGKGPREVELMQADDCRDSVLPADLLQKAENLFRRGRIEARHRLVRQD